MKIYKIYANCCVNPRPITIISKNEADAYILDTVDHIIDCNPDLITGDNESEWLAAYDNVYSKAIAFFEKEGFFYCGDFAITISDEPPTRGNSYGYTNTFFNRLNKAPVKGAFLMP